MKSYYNAMTNYCSSSNSHDNVLQLGQGTAGGLGASQIFWQVKFSGELLGINFWISHSELFDFLAFLTLAHFGINEDVVQEIKHSCLNSRDFFTFVDFARHTFTKGNRIGVFTGFNALVHQRLIHLKLDILAELQS